MKEVRGSIWALSKPLDYVTIPYPLGWRKDGTAVLQTGLALQAAQRYEDLELWLGDHCLRHSPKVGVVVHRPRAAASRNLILFPVYPLNELSPQLSWKQKPSLQLIERSAKELEEMIATGYVRATSNVFITPIGVYEEELEEQSVLPILDRHLGRFSNVQLVRRGGKRKKAVDLRRPAPVQAAPQQAQSTAMTENQPSLTGVRST